MDCENCKRGPEPVYSSQLNYDAINQWHLLDIMGRDIDGYCGIPKALRIEAIETACRDYPDPNGLKWRIMIFEEKIYSIRVKKFNAEMRKRNKK